MFSYSGFGADEATDATAETSTTDDVLNALSKLVDIGGKVAIVKEKLAAPTKPVITPTTIVTPAKPAGQWGTMSWVLLGFGGLLLLGTGAYILAKK